VADRERQLALDLLRQHPDRDRLAVLHHPAPADRQEPASDTQFRHPGRRAVHDRDQRAADRAHVQGPDQRRDARALRVDRLAGRRTDHRGPHRLRPLHPGRGPGGGADHPAQPVPHPDLRGLDGVDVLRRLRVLRRDHLPAALVPDRPGLQPDQLRSGRAAARHRPDRELDRVRPVRGANRPLQVAARRRDLADGDRDAAHDPAPRRHAGAGRVALDEIHVEHVPVVFGP